MRRTLWLIPGAQQALESLLASGCSASEAATALSRKFRTNISRSAVIGRARRTGLTFQRAHRRQYTDEQRIAVAVKKGVIQ